MAYCRVWCWGCYWCVSSLAGSSLGWEPPTDKIPAPPSYPLLSLDITCSWDNGSNCHPHPPPYHPPPLLLLLPFIIALLLLIIVIQIILESQMVRHCVQRRFLKVHGYNLVPCDFSKRGIEINWNIMRKKEIFTKLGGSGSTELNWCIFPQIVAQCSLFSRNIRESLNKLAGRTCPHVSSFHSNLQNVFQFKRTWPNECHPDNWHVEKVKKWANQAIWGPINDLQWDRTQMHPRTWAR